MLKNLSIRNKLFWIIITLVVLAMMIGNAIITWRNLQDYRKDLVMQTLTNARLASRYVLSPMLFDDPQGVAQNLSDLKSNETVHYAEVFDKQNKSIAFFNPYQNHFNPDTIPAQQHYYMRNNFLHVFVPVLYKNKTYGTVYVVASTKRVQEKLHDFIFIVLLTTLVIVLFAALLANWLQRWISLPVKDLLKATQKVTIENNLSYRAKKITNDETGELVESFNYMLSKLEHETSERENAIQALKENEEQLKKTTESAFDAILLVDRQYAIKSWNKAASTIFGYSKEEASQQSFLDLFVSRQDILDLLKKTSQNGNSSHGEVEMPAMKKNETKFPVEIALDATTLNEEMYYVATIRDKSQQKKYEQELINAKEKAEESDKLKSAFLANMSHEIRTPLNAIIGFSELLDNPSLFENKRQEYLQYIGTSGKNLLNLINDIIDVSKIEAGQLKIKKSEIDILQILQETYTSYKNLNALKQNHNLDLLLDIPVIEELRVFSDPYRLNQIINNLLNNAVKFTEEGFIKLGMRIVKGRDLLFFVQDTGMGIPEDKQEEIFDRFGQAHDRFTKNQGGTGLGLSISQKLVRLLGGDMWVEATPDQGSTFYFTIPYDAVVNVHQKEQAKDDNTMTHYEWNNKTILIAEDEEINYMFVLEALRITNANILWAKDGKEAVDMCRAHKEIGIVLMDVKMPVMDGYEACRIIKEERPSLPVIAQTAYAMSGEKERSRNASCDDFIAKPIKPTNLLDMISKHI